MSVFTCVVCGGIAEYLLFCNKCGAAACEKHLRQQCLVCRHGTWSIQVRYLTDAVSSVVGRMRSGVASPHCDALSPCPQPLSVSEMVQEIEQMARYCFERNGPGLLPLFLDPLAPDLLGEIITRLQTDGMRVVYDGMAGMLVIWCDVSLLREGLNAISPQEMGFSVTYTPFTQTSPAEDTGP